jgi:hypothetical protein
MQLSGRGGSREKKCSVGRGGVITDHFTVQEHKEFRIIRLQSSYMRREIMALELQALNSQMMKEKRNICLFLDQAASLWVKKISFDLSEQNLIIFR